MALIHYHGEGTFFPKERPLDWTGGDVTFAPPGPLPMNRQERRKAAAKLRRLRASQ